jgi:hypothetical protein
MGLAFALPSGGFSPSGTANLRWFADNATAYDLILGVNLAKTSDTTMGNPPVTVPGATTFGATVGFGLRMYKHHSERVHTFLEPFALLSDKDFSAFADVLAISVGAQMGAEVMFADWFSVSGAVGLEADFTNKFKDINVGTATGGLYANMYWQ